ncbi:hypothetical protein [Paludisphaera sp.]|uniref:hypothetical protein n=1 Tax=Paludisphaera sp. TaxID=2017432 RepID=UPI00301C1D1A
MSRTSDCPDASVLLALAAGEDAAPEVRAHVAACPHCGRALRRLRAEIAHLRSSVDADSDAESPPGSPPAGD